MNIIFTAKGGRINFETDYGQHRFNQFLLDNEGKKFKIEKLRNPVSDELRGYYYAAVLPMVKSTIPEWSGLSDEDVHEILKKQFTSFKYFNVFTKRTELVGRSAISNASNSKRAMDFIEKIREWLATDYYVELPSPEDYKNERDSAPMK